MGVRYHFGFRVGQGVVNTRFSGDPNVGRLYGLPTFGWFRYPSVGESSVRRLIAAAALAAAATAGTLTNTWIVRVAVLDSLGTLVG